MAVCRRNRSWNVLRSIIKIMVEKMRSKTRLKKATETTTRNMKLKSKKWWNLSTFEASICASASILLSFVEMLSEPFFGSAVLMRKESQLKDNVGNLLPVGMDFRGSFRIVRRINICTQFNV